MVWRRQDLSSFLCWLIQRIVLPSREAAPVAGHSVVLCKAFPGSHMGSAVERELSQGGKTNFSHSPSSLLPFLSPQLLKASLPEKGKICVAVGLPLCAACDPLPTSSLQPLSPHQQAHRERKTQECTRRSMGLGLDQKCPSLLDRTHQETKTFASKTSKKCFLKPPAFAEANWRVGCDSHGGYVVAINIFNTHSLLNIAKKKPLCLLMPFVHSSPVRSHILKSESLNIVLIKQEEFWQGFTSILVKPS